MKTTISISILLVPILGFLAISYSTYQTAIGYELAAGSLFKSSIYATMISIGLIILNLQLWQNMQLKNIKQSIVTSFFYICVALFSFVANFNAFYSQFMEKEILYDNLEELRAQADSIKTKSFNSLDSKFNTDSIRNEVSQHAINLEKQIMDPFNKGVGPKAREIIIDIEKILGTKLTTFEGTPEAKAKQYKNLIQSQLDTVLSIMAKKPTAIKKEFELKISDLLKQIDAAKTTKDNIEDDQIAIELGVNILNSLGKKTEQTINDSNYFIFKRLTAKHQEIGKISHSFNLARHAIRNGNNVEAVVFAILLSLFIDFLVPFMIIVLNSSYRYNFSTNLNAFPTRRNTESQTESKFPQREKSKEASEGNLIDQLKNKGKTK